MAHAPSGPMAEVVCQDALEALLAAAAARRRGILLTTAEQPWVAEQQSAMDHLLGSQVNLGQKGPQEFSSPTACSQHGWLQDQTRLLGALPSSL